jgi:chromosome segregation ATPase
MFGTAKLIMVGIMVTGLAGGVAYTYKLKADNEMLKANAIKMESAISEQKQVIENQKKDFAEILEANKKINELVNNLKKDLDDLDKRFSKKDRDIGKLAIERTGAIERVINKGSDNATRCIEIASGSPLTEKEKNATKKSEINPECPSIANPSYVPY